MELAEYIQKCAEGFSKTCSKCKEQKALKDFRASGYNGKRGHKVYASWCKVCARAAVKSSTKKADTYKEYRLRTEFGLSLAEFNSMLEVQNHVCAICKKPQAGKALSVDHDHATGTIRGLLCSNCNHGLGHFRDSPDLLSTAINYLNKER